MRNKLIELIQDATDEFAEEGWKHFECVGTPPFSCVPTICRSEFIADHLIANGVTIQGKKEEHPMRYKNFEIREIRSQHPKYEIVRWFDTAHNEKPWCYVVAFIRWNPKEPCWVFESVGTRFIDDYENGLCEFISMFMKDKTPKED